MLTSGHGELLRWLSVLVCLLSFSTSEHRDLRCPTVPDDIFHGIMVDCSSKHLEPSDIPILDIPVNYTTSLLLNYNRLPHIKNESFSRFKKLCRLQVDFSGITYLELDAFEGLAELQVLSLYGNSLDIVQNAIPFGVFGHTPLLKELNIGNNAIDTNYGNYSSFIDIFNSLPELHYLYINSFSILFLGKEFEKLTQLERLDVYGHVPSYILNNSLEGLQYSNLKHFKLSFANPYQSETGVFRSLPRDIRSLTLYQVNVGNTKLLSAMEPLQGRTIPDLYFNTVSLPTTINSILQIEDGIIHCGKLKHLLNICIFNLTWKNSNLLALDLKFHVNSTFLSCLKSLDLSGNKLQFYQFAIINKLAPMHFLEVLKLSHDGLPEHTVSFWDQDEEISFKTCQIHGLQTDPSLVTEGGKRNCTLARFSPSSTIHNNRFENKYGQYLLKEIILNQDQLKDVEFILSKSDDKELSLPNHPSNSSLPNATINQTSPKSTFYIFFPEHLRYASFDNFRGLDFGESYDYLKFKSPNNLTELYFRYATMPVIVKCLILGLNNVRLIDFTGSVIQKIPLSFFDYFPSLRVLVLSQTLEDGDFIQIYGHRLIKNIVKLIYLDLSDNGLSVLPKGIFKENRFLRYLCLAKNRFSMIPFQIKLTPSLERLDLRTNAFSSLDKDEQINIDEHFTINRGENFTLFLEGNNLQCICSDLFFAAWMKRTHIRFDPNGRLTCLGEDGKSVKIDSFSDTEQMWRKCNGQYYFMFSLVLLFAMLVLYLGVFLISMYRTFIIGKLKQMFVPEFQRQTRQDFAYDVFIGYAEQDCGFVRSHLLRYLEGHLKLKAFVHQRDLRQDLLELGSALKESWRTLLVTTEAFLAHEMSENIMKTATFFESPSKQDSIVVMVTQELLYAIPDYVLRVVKDENIIVLPDLETPLSYEARETLRTRILY